MLPLLMALILSGSAAVAPKPPRLQIEKRGDVVVVSRVGEGEALVADNAAAGFRPYLHPLMAPDRRGVLTEVSPGHHKHQTGLYWGFTRVNGRDYFHHPEESYWRRGSLGSISARGPVARWSHTYDLLGEDGKPVLRQTMKWTVTDGGDHYTVDLDWQGRALVDVSFDQYDYGGLFLRMPWKKETGGTAVNSEGQEGKAAEGQRARWVDVGMPIAGRDDWAHIVIMDHPRNDGHPLPWRVDGQLGVGPCPARLGAWKLPKGGRASFRHRLLVYTGAIDQARIQASWERFAR